MRVVIHNLRPCFSYGKRLLVLLRWEGLQLSQMEEFQYLMRAAGCTSCSNIDTNLDHGRKEGAKPEGEACGYHQFLSKSTPGLGYLISKNRYRAQQFGKTPELRC